MSELQRLEIAVPTYNRAECLSRFCDSLQRALERVPKNEILISFYDNASTDSTADVISNFSATWPHVRVIRHAANIGGSANIAQALVSATADYVWLMSDHMLLSSGAVETVQSCIGLGNVDLVYCGIADYALSLPAPNIPATLQTLPAKEIANLFFGLSNISGLLARSEIVRSAAGEIRICGERSYPHLGVWNYLQQRENGVVMSTGPVSNFQKMHSAPRYNWFESGALDYGEVFAAGGKKLKPGDLLRCQRFFRTCFRTLAGTGGIETLPFGSQVRRFEKIYGMRGRLAIWASAPLRMKHCGSLRFRPDSMEPVSRFN